MSVTTYSSTVMERGTKVFQNTKLRSYFWYLGFPLLFFILLSPGFLLSIPPVANCDTGNTEVIAPSRVTVLNVFVHSFVFLLLLLLMFWVGSSKGIIFPFFKDSINYHS